MEPNDVMNCAICVAIALTIFSQDLITGIFGGMVTYIGLSVVLSL